MSKYFCHPFVFNSQNEPYYENNEKNPRSKIHHPPPLLLIEITLSGNVDLISSFLHYPVSTKRKAAKNDSSVLQLLHQLA